MVDDNIGQVVMYGIGSRDGRIEATELTRRPVPNGLIGRVAGASAEADDATSPSGTYLATSTSPICLSAGCTGEHALFIKSKYSPFRHKLLSGVPINRVLWLDDDHLLVEGPTGAVIVDTQGKIHQTLPGQVSEISPP